MSRVTRSAATSYALSLAAMEETSRVGLRQADLEHLFLALSISEEPAGQVLRAEGVTLRAAREAIAEHHTEHLRALGVDHEPPAPGPIVFHQTGGYEWSERAQRVFSLANKHGSGDAGAVLRELLAEPSGLAAELLARLGTSAAAVTERLEVAERIPTFGSHRAQAGPGAERPGVAAEREVTSPGASPARNQLMRTGTAFVPAPVAEVWELLIAAERMPEWDAIVGEVELPAELRGLHPKLGDAWAATARSETPDGKPMRVRPERRSLLVELTQLDEHLRIEWRMSFPDEPSANTRVIALSLAPAAGGTQLGMTFGWQPTADRPAAGPLRRAQRVLLRPALRFVLWLQVAQLGSGISRVFRSA